MTLITPPSPVISAARWTIALGVLALNVAGCSEADGAPGSVADGGDGTPRSAASRARSVDITWSGTADTDLAYYIYYGPGSDDVAFLARRVERDGGRPERVYTARFALGEELHVAEATQVCFAISTLTAVGEAERSDTMCVPVGR